MSDPVRPQPSAPDPAWELFQRIRQSEGERIFWKMETLRASYFVFSGNYAELIKAIAYFENPDNFEEYAPVEKREHLRNFQREHMRLLHNYLASAFSLVDHTRILVRGIYSKLPFKEEYEQKVKELFSESDICGFVKGLRIWILHKGILPIVMEATLNSDHETFTSSVRLEIEKLAGWEKWDSRARKYLSNAGARPRLLGVINSYHERIEQFYLWLGARMLHIHAGAFREVAELQEQYEAFRA